MRYKITIISMLFSVLAYAQVPGYLGKRFSIGYSANLSPAVLSPTANGDVTKDAQFGINLLHSIDLEFVIKKRTAFCASLQFFKTGLSRNDSYAYDYNDPYYGGASYGYATYEPKDDKPMQLKTTNISLGFKFYRSGFIAPVGKYQKLELVIFIDKATYNKSAFYDNGYSYPVPAIGPGEYNFKSFAIGYTIGKQRIFFNSLILDTGIRFGFSPNVLLNAAGSVFSSSDNQDIEKSIKSDVQTRVFTSQLVNFHIGLGFLAF